MKKAEEIQVGDTPYIWNAKEGLVQLPKIKSIVVPSERLGEYVFHMESGWIRLVTMMPGCVFGRYWEHDSDLLSHVFVPHSHNEIAFMKEIFDAEYKKAQADIRQSLRNVLGI